MASLCVALKIIWQHLKRPGFFFFGCFKRRDAHLCPGDIRSRYSSGTAGEGDGRSFDCAEYLRAMLNGGNHCKNESKRRYGRISSSGIYRIYSMHFELCVESVPGCLHITATTDFLCVSRASGKKLSMHCSVQMFLFYFCAFFPSRSLFLWLCHSKDSAEEIITRRLVTFFWKHDLAKQLHHVECTQYKTQHGVLAAHFAQFLMTYCKINTSDLCMPTWKWPNPTNLKEPLL